MQQHDVHPSGVAALALVVVNVHQFLDVGWTTLTWFSLVAIPVLALWCTVASRREKCRTEVRMTPQQEVDDEHRNSTP